jgi:hypothetical protein
VNNGDKWLKIRLFSTTYVRVFSADIRRIVSPPGGKFDAFSGLTVYMGVGSSDSGEDAEEENRTS